MARPDLHTLLLEQEVAIDDLFERAARAMVARIQAGKKMTAAQVGRIVREELDAIFGVRNTDAIRSPLGLLVTAYANAARRLVFRRAVANIGLVLGKDEQVRRLRASIPEAQTLKAVNDALEAILPALDGPLRTGHMVDPWTEPEYTSIPPAAAAILQPILAGHDINFDGVKQIGQATIANQALLTAMAHTGVIPKSVDDTTRWVGEDRKRLADRLQDAGNQTFRHIKSRFIDRYAIHQDRSKMTEDLEFYLVANFNPPRQAGAITARTEIGQFTSQGTGKGSFLARRIGRHETARAYGNAIRDVVRSSETTPALKWVLTPAHPGADDCDDLATNASPGLPPGCYFIDDAPFYPNHYGCLCVLEMVDAEGEEPARRYREDLVRREEETTDGP